MIVVQFEDRYFIPARHGEEGSFMWVDEPDGEVWREVDLDEIPEEE